MNIYLLEREDGVGYDEYDGFVIIERTEQNAREKANSQPGAEGQIWANETKVRCQKVGTSNLPAGVLLGSYNAG